MENNQNGESQSTEEPQDKLTFEKLTPTHLPDKEMKGYTEALDFVFEERDLLNIAITGPYASGKSSVIKTYEENRKKTDEPFNGIHISLSYFSPILESKIKGKKKDDELAFEDELMLERKIINQLIHQIDPTKIPATDFKVKSESKARFRIMWSIIISLVILFVIYKNETWFTTILNEHLLFTLTTLGIFIAIVTFMIIKLQSGNNLIGKLKIFENEIDISSSECDVSYFDKYLNEIIYILDKSKLNYIVFEDIDRYDDNLILNKLRELNYTYNKKQANNQPKPIKFIYLIKDEIFESKERTKFFDYILPIVPVMDNSNSLGKIQEIFEDRKISGDFSETFLNTLSLYLDDIRLIKNICNEYIIYKNKLANDANWFKYEKLLAIVVYKNIFPADFSLTRLGLGQGVVHRIIKSLYDQKNKIYNDRCKSIDDEIKEQKSEIELLDSCFLQNLDELDALYICLTNNSHPYDNISTINGTPVRNKNNVEIVNLLKKNKYQAKNFNNYDVNNIEQKFEFLDTIPEYLKRKQILTLSQKKTQQALREKIKVLEKEKIQTKRPKNIVEIIAHLENNGTNLDILLEKHIENEKEKTQSKAHDGKISTSKEESPAERYKKEYSKLSSSCYFPLLKYFIREGYIDEHYSDYMTFFNSKGLSHNDVQYLRNIKERVDNAWELELRKPALVLQTLNADGSARFKESSVLNYSLLDHMLGANKTTDLSLFISLLKSQHKVEFIDAYLARYYAFLVNEDDRYTRRNLYVFIGKLNEQFPEIWHYIDIFDKKLYIYLSLIHCKQALIDGMNQDRRLKTFIDLTKDFLLINDEWHTIFNLLDKKQYNLNIIIEYFVKLNIKFLNIEDATPQLLELVEESNTYQLNHFNAKYILENKYHLNDFASHTIQTILTLGDDAPIKLYFEDNLEESVLSLTESDVTNIDDNEETVLFILNHDEISSSAKMAYIDKLATTISELDKITDKNIWDKLLEKQKIQYSAENIVYYFLHYELAENDEEDDSKNENRVINEQLAKFINQNDKNISSKEANLSNLVTDDNNKNIFFERVVINTDIENTKYSMLIAWFNGLTYADFDIKNLVKEKMSILIQHKAIRLLNGPDLNFLRKNYPDNILELIVNNFSDYIEMLKNDMSLVDHEEIINLLSKDLTLEHKLVLIGLTSKPISINNTNYSTEIKKHILDTNFDVNDLAYITSDQFYNSTINEIRGKIKGLCIEYQTQILDLEQISYRLLIELFDTKDFPLDKKYTLLSHQLRHFNEKQVHFAFKKIELDSTNQSFFSHLFIGKRSSFENTDLNKKIMEALNNKWEFTFKVEENQINAKGKKLIK